MKPTAQIKRGWLAQAYKRIERSGAAADVDLVKPVAKVVESRARTGRTYQRGDQLQLDETAPSSPYARVLIAGHGVVQVTLEAQSVIDWLT